MHINKFFVAAGSLLASGAAFAGLTAVGTPAGGVVGILVGQRLGTFLDVGLPAMLVVAAAGLAIGVRIVRRKQKR